MENFDKLLNYLEGSLSEAEKTDFEAEMEQNLQLREELAMMRLAQDAVRSAGAREVVEEVQRNFFENRKPKGKQVFLGRYALKYAAIIFAIFTFWGAFQVSQINSNTILADYGISYIEPVMRSTEAEQAEFKLNYQNKEFEKLLKSLPAIEQPTAEQYFLSSMAAFELEKYPLAQQYLSKASIMDQESIYQNEIPYYEGLIALGQEQYAQAYELLSNVKNNPLNPYSMAVSRSLLIKLRFLIFFKTK